ncbi:MAG: hypothetical protein ACLQBK_15095 [Candidatus Sulfotelmatobacter sp.]
MKTRNNAAKMALAVVLCLTMALTGCSTAWIAEGEEIVAALIPAAANLLALVAALQGKTVSAADLQTIQSAGTQAGAGLQLVQSLITAYQKADAAAKPGILNQIQSAIGAVQANVEGLLPALHIKDTATQTKITALVGILLAEVQSLAAIVPLVSGGPTLAAKDAARIGHRAPLTAREFVASYNATLTAKTGNADLDRVAAGFEVHEHGKAARWVTGGMLK